MTIHTDINTQSWIERLPLKLRPYAHLARLDRPIGIWLLLLPGWWAIALAAGGLFKFAAADWFLLLLFGLGAIIMRAAGCVLNDLWDRKLDQQVERTQNRPLAAGTLAPKQAIIFLIILLILGFTILLQLQPVAILLGVMVMPLIAVYPLMKRFTWWPQAFLGITFNFSALIGWAAVTGVVSHSSLILYAGAFFWTLGYDTIYAHQDKEDDLRVGIKSTALKFGEKSKTWVQMFFAASWLLVFCSFILAKAGILSLLILPVAAYHLYKLLESWNPGSPPSSLQSFKANRDFGFLVLLAALI